MTLKNFGRNVRFEPAIVETLPDKNAVLGCLERYRGHEIRAVGSLHSWSEAAFCQDVLLDLRHLNHVTLEILGDGSAYAEIEAGCTIDAALDYLRVHGGYTLPTYGVIGKQTIAGAIATATHGSGRASLSHYVSSVCVAAYDEASGRARVYTWNGEDELRAARCGLGCMGIVVSVRMPVEPDYLIEEKPKSFERIEEILEQEHAYPRTQFYLIPWSWKWYAQLRRPLTRESGAVPSCTALIRRIAQPALVDYGFNGAVRFLSGYLRWWAAVRWLCRRLFPAITRLGLPVIDESRRMLTMRHDIYTHVEMELFVPTRHVAHAAAFVEWVLRSCGGESPQMPAALMDDDFGMDPTHEIEALRRSYVHDYLITFRRVLRDDTLISMTSGDEAEAWYAISLITYQRDHGPFLRMAGFLAAAMASAYRARPHWGKICPLDGKRIWALYPALPLFRALCAAVDPQQAFVNSFARRALGFKPDPVLRKADETSC